MAAGKAARKESFDFSGCRRMVDIIVIGGGPGGLFAARDLAKKGFSVTVLEEHSTFGNPVHCTGVLAASAYEEYDLPRNAILNELQTARFFSPAGQNFAYTPPRVEAVVVDRVYFDDSLRQQAQAAGARMISGKKVTGIHVDDAGVQVTVSNSGETFRARVCILACGSNYALQRSLGLGMPAIFLQSAQAEVPAANPGEVELYFGEKVAPKGFAWVVPVRRGSESWARVGLMCESKSEMHFRNFAAAVGSRWGIPEGLEFEPRLRMLPLAPITRTFSDRLVVIGDAAGLVKATTGGGIYYSIVRAALAVNVLASVLPTDRLDANSLSEYEKRWKEILASELEAQLTFRSHTEGLMDPEIEELFDLVLTDGIIPLVRKTASFNRHRKLILALLQHKQFRQVLMRTLPV
jgi:digeranylgeranylglycerophospholipid reductase